MRKWSAGILLTVAGACLGLLLTESLLRFFPQYRFDAMVWQASIEDRPWSHQYRSSPVFGYELIPHADPGINSFGMRDKEYSLRKPDGAFRILVLGDSITELGRWSEYLEEMLDRTGRYEVLNAAVIGWGLYPYRAYLEHKGMGFAPDLVIVGLCLNDADEVSCVPTLLPDRRNNRVLHFCVKDRTGNRTDLTLTVQPFLFRYSYAYRFFMAEIWWRKALANRPPENNAAAMLRDMKARMRGRIRGIVFPFLKPLDSYDDWERWQYDQTIKALKDAGIGYYDLTPYFNTYGPGIVSFRQYSNDKIHFNDDANRLKAGLIYRWLQENKVLQGNLP